MVRGSSNHFRDDVIEEADICQEFEEGNSKGVMMGSPVKRT